MLISGNKLANCPILSLHVSNEIARVTEPIIDPNSLKVIGFKLEGKMIRDEVGDVLPITSVREFSRMGMIVDSIDEFVKADDVMRIQKILELNFTLPGLKVVTRKKAKLGKVADYIVDINTWYVHQIIVQRPFVKAFFDPELTIPRSKIVEVTDYEVIIKDEHEKVKSKVEKINTSDFVPNFINPFREPDFANDRVTKK